MRLLRFVKRLDIDGIAQVAGARRVDECGDLRGGIKS